MEEIVWSVRESNDVRTIYQYIAMDSKFFANKWLEKIAARINMLPAQPNIGRIIPERNDQNLREIIDGNYRIMYRVSKKQIIIYRIIHSARFFR